MLPYITAYALELHWWPYLFFGFAIALALISIFSRWPNSIFYHMLIGILVIESAILLLSQIAFALPSIQMWSNVPDLNYPK